VLERIVAASRTRLQATRTRVAEAELRQQALSRRSLQLPKKPSGGRNFADALRARRGVPAIIAELKKASPSKGLLRPDFDVAGLAGQYRRAGAAAISVLTEEAFFQGRLESLDIARGATGLPILRKDFIFDAYQVWEAAAYGADALLLIVAMLGDGDLRGLLNCCDEAGLDALVEAHTEAELERALAAGARIVGVNNRDLHTFDVDFERCLALAARMPVETIRVAESGFANADDLLTAAKAGYDAVLIGEHLMRAAQPGDALASLLAAARGRGPVEPSFPGFVKICGITGVADARAAVSAGASAVGFVFAQSARQIPAGAAAAMAAELPAGVLKTGVFVNASDSEVFATVADARLDAVQLQGDESPALGRALARAGVFVIRALRVGDQSEDELLASARQWFGAADALLLDAAVPGQLGGAGRAFDWGRAPALVTRSPIPVILAGGLTPENVAVALAATGCAGVDVSTGVEARSEARSTEVSAARAATMSSPRAHAKDPARISAFIAAARAAFTGYA
jgi:indole-3-glycerol phosphate synthase/phosphoribosylanthranilate isomerase